jgi:hypothetical protein
MEFDLSKFELADTAVLTVQNATGDDDLIGADGVSPVTIELYGSGSEQMVKAAHKAGQRAAVRVQSLVRGKLNKREPEIAEEEEVERLVAATRAINNFPVSAQDLYANPKLGYITKQVQKFLGDDANFTQGSTKS